MNLSHLYEFCTVRQLEVVQAIEKAGSIRGGARALGVDYSAAHQNLTLAKKKAAQQLPAMHDYTKRVPDGFGLKGISQYIDKDGKVAGQWVKSTADQQRQAEIQKAAFEALSEELPRMKPSTCPENVSKSLCNVYTLTDSHVGMLAWHKEGGADWDLSIAEQTLTGCFSAMISASPKAQTCVVAQLGDWLHYDGLLPITPAHGNVLDADGRFSKMVQVAVRILRRVVDMALAKHEKVIVLMAEGNHDIASSVWLRVMFKALYENEPRIQVIESELPYYTYQHGNTMLAWHHGHMQKNDQLPILFAAQFPKVWGATEKRYCHTGHRHHVEEKEHSGMTVIQHPTLAARDAYAARGGWIAERQVTSITYSDKFGQVARNTVTPEMLA